MFREHSIPFVISTDNPAICQTSMSEELFQMYYSNGMSFQEIINILKDSVKYSFASAEVKSKLLTELKEREEA